MYGNFRGLVAHSNGELTYQQVTNYFSNRGVAKDTERKILLNVKSYLLKLERTDKENAELLRSLTK